MLQTGQRAPDIRLPDVQGKVTALEQFFANPNEPVLVAIFKVSCPTCQLTMPFLERLYRQRAQVVGISQDNEAATKDFAAHYGLTFPILMDAPKYTVSRGFEISNVPSLFLVRENNSIDWDSAGFVKKDLEQLGHLLHMGVFREDDKVPELKPG